MTSSAVLSHPSEVGTPRLEAGDRLTREEFERRYEAMHDVKKAELIEGIVYMPSPVRIQKHARPHLKLSQWLGAYEDAMPSTLAGDNATVRLDFDNEPQPDLVLVKRAEHGGRSSISDDGYIEGAPEFVAEIVASTRSYDLHQKKGAYRRNGVREYLAWIIGENRIVWWELRDGEYQEIAPDADGILKSGIFLGLWLDAEALLRSDMKVVFATLQRGLEPMR